MGIVGQADQLSGWQSKLSETRISQQKKQKRKRTKKKKKTEKEKKKKKKKTKKKKKKKKKRRASPLSDDDDAEDEEEEEDVNVLSFDGSAWVYDAVTDDMVQTQVAKSKKCVKLVPLATPRENENDNENEQDTVPISKRVRGAKGLETARFSCGILEIPPDSMKPAEISFFTEQFFVHKCERKQLLFKLGEDEFRLSRGSMFFVPPENEYSLHNLSQTHAVQLIFTLIKDEANDNDNDNDEEDATHMQMTQLST